MHALFSKGLNGAEKWLKDKKQCSNHGPKTREDTRLFHDVHLQPVPQTVVMTAIIALSLVSGVKDNLPPLCLLDAALELVEPVEHHVPPVSG